MRCHAGSLESREPHPASEGLPTPLANGKGGGERRGFARSQTPRTEFPRLSTAPSPRPPPGKALIGQGKGSLRPMAKQPGWRRSVPSLALGWKRLRRHPVRAPRGEKGRRGLACGRFSFPTGLLSGSPLFSWGGESSRGEAGLLLRLGLLQGFSPKVTSSALLSSSPGKAVVRQE